MCVYRECDQYIPTKFKNRIIYCYNVFDILFNEKTGIIKQTLSIELSIIQLFIFCTFHYLGRRFQSINFNH